MKKLFVSVPMKGREPEDIVVSIEKMKSIVEAYLCDEVELVNPYCKKKVPKGCNDNIWMLGESIKKMAKADIVAGVDEYWDYSGCKHEMQIARCYGIKTIELDRSLVCPDINDVITNLSTEVRVNE